MLKRLSAGIAVAVVLAGCGASTTMTSNEQLKQIAAWEDVTNRMIAVLTADKNQITSLATALVMPQIAAECHRYSLELAEVQRSDPYPVPSGEKLWSKYLATMSQGASLCVAGATNNNQWLLVEGNHKWRQGASIFAKFRAEVPKEGTSF